MQMYIAALTLLASGSDKAMLQEGTVTAIVGEQLLSLQLFVISCS